MKRLVCVVAAITLAGCMASGVNVTEDQAKQFETGKATLEEVVAKLGRPTYNVVNYDGTRALVYGYAAVQARPESFIPFVGPLVGGADVRSNAVTFIFGPDDKLQKWAASSSETGTGMGAASGATYDRVPDQPRY